MFDKIVLIIILLLSIVTLFFAFAPDKIFGNEKKSDPFDRVKLLILALLSFAVTFSLFKECFPPETIVQDGYTYVLTDEPAEHIKANGHLYKLKGGEADENDIHKTYTGASETESKESKGE